MTTTPCSLVKRAVAPHEMRAFLRGDRKAAVSSIVSSQRGWSEDEGWGQVTAKGVGVFAHLADTRDPNAALLFVTWSEVAYVIWQGSWPELIADFDAASALWTAWCEADRGTTGWRRDMDEAELAAWRAHSDAYSVATRAMGAATEAIIWPPRSERSVSCRRSRSSARAARTSCSSATGGRSARSSPASR